MGTNNKNKFGISSLCAVHTTLIMLMDEGGRLLTKIVKIETNSVKTM